MLKAAFGLSEAPVNIYSMAGMTWALSSHYFPLAYLVLGPALRALDLRMEEAALMAGGSYPQVFARVTLPLLRPAILSALLLLFSTFVNAPLRELANPNLTPNPSKAPWYFLGLQELLRYFHPMVAGVTIPTFILVGLAVIPFVDRNPSNRPGDRKLAITLFTMLFMFGATLTIIGCFFRGPGFNWVWPWSQGLFFEL